MPGDSDLDLLLAAETSELQAIDAPAESQVSDSFPPARVPGNAQIQTPPQLDDVAVRADEPEELLGDEEESDPAAGNSEADVDKDETPAVRADVSGPLRPDLRLDNFGHNRTAPKNRHIAPLVTLARRIVASIGDRCRVQRVRVTGVFSPVEPRSRVVAEDRARAVTAALREAVDRMWSGLGARVEFLTTARVSDGVGSSARNSVASRRAVEIFLEFADMPDEVRYPAISRTDHDGFAWQFSAGENPAATSADGTVDPQPLRALSADGYFFVLSTEAPPSRWICSLEMTMESEDTHLPHAEYSTQLQATGLLVSPRHLLTAAHCVFSRLRESSVCESEAGDARLEDPVLCAKSISVFPGRSGGALPFGSYAIRDPRSIRASARWRVSRAANIDSDFALLTLERPLAIGSWGKPPYHIAALPDDQLKGAVVYTAGYPRQCRFDAPLANSSDATWALRAAAEDTQWSTFGSVTDIARDSFSHDLPFRPGQDGSPVWIQHGNDRKLAGILLGKNRALRLTAHMIKILRKWVAQDGCWSAT